MTSSDHITSVSTTRGDIVRVGQLYRDRRLDNVRTLRVDGLSGVGKYAKASCTVIRQNYRGETTHPMRTTTPSVARLVSSAFVLVTDDREQIAGVIAEHVVETITQGEDRAVLIDCSCGAEVAGTLGADDESFIGSTQRVMAAHIADMVAEATGRDGTR